MGLIALRPTRRRSNELFANVMSPNPVTADQSSAWAAFVHSDETYTLITLMKITAQQMPPHGNRMTPVRTSSDGVATGNANGKTTPRRTATPTVTATLI